MTLPGPREVDAAIAPTWPAERTWRVGALTLRDGGGGQRATAATAEAGPSGAELDRAEAEMLGLRGEALFRLRPWEDDLDAELEARGYVVRDPTNMLAMPVTVLADRPLKPVTAFTIWPPLAIMEELWTESGAGPDRQANMWRASAPRAGILARGNDKPAGVGFVSVHNGIAVVHAVAVRPALRRQKIAENMMIAAARWAQKNGADWLATLCTCHNSAANSLYTSLGMLVVGRYHYRAKTSTVRALEGTGE